MPRHGYCNYCKLIGSISCFKSFGVTDFDAKVAMDVFGNVDGTICGLFFELFSDMVGNVTASCLCMTKMIEAKASMLVIVCFDSAEGGSTDC